MNSIDTLAIKDSIHYYKNISRKALPKYYINYKLGTFYYQLFSAKYFKYTALDSFYTRKYYKGNDFDIARHYFHKSLKKNKNFAPSWLYVALTDYNFSSRMEELGKAIELDSNNPTYYFYRAQTESATFLTDAAIKDFTKCIQLNHNDYRSYVGRACNLALKLNGFIPSKSEIQSIENDFETALDLSGDSSAILYQRGMARCYYLKNYSGAIADYNKILEIDSAFKWIYRERAVAYYFTKQYDLSCADFKKSRELGSTSYDWEIKDVCGIEYKDWIKKK